MAGFEEVRAGGTADDYAAAIEHAVEWLRRGGILAHPTSTVYGLGGAPQADVDASIQRLKGRREPFGPLLRVVADRAVAREGLPGLQWDVRAERLGRAFWPGPLTLILPDGSATGTAVRVEGHPVLRRVLRRWDAPMSSTSLNATGGHAAVTPAEARRILTDLPDGDRPVLFLATGVLGGPPPSTIVSLLGSEWRIVREGAVPEDRILDCLGARRKA